MAKKNHTKRCLKILTELVTLLAIASCSEPQGWTLWIHTYSVEEGDALRPSDEWSSFDTYLTPADCKKQIEPHLTLVEKSNQESKALLEGYRLTIEETNKA